MVHSASRSRNQCGDEQTGKMDHDVGALSVLHPGSHRTLSRQAYFSVKGAETNVQVCGCSSAKETPAQPVSSSAKRSSAPAPHIDSDVGLKRNDVFEEDWWV